MLKLIMEEWSQKESEWEEKLRKDSNVGGVERNYGIDHSEHKETQ